MNGSPTRQAMAIILAVSLLVVMTSIATTFMLMMRDMRGHGDLSAKRQRLEAFIVEASERCQAFLIADAAEPDGYTSFADDWFQEHLSVDFDGNPTWLHQQPDPNLNANVPAKLQLWAPYCGWRFQSGGEYDHMQSLSKFPVPQYDVYGLGQGPGLNSWRYRHWLDDDMAPIDVIDGVDPRRQARYALRYAACIFDNNAMLSIAPDWPGRPHPVDASHPRYDDFLRYQNYLHHHSRGLKNMVAVDENRAQRRPSNPENNPVWPWDREYVNANLTGERRGGGPLGNAADLRQRIDNVFRGTGLQQYYWDELKADSWAYQSNVSGVHTIHQLRSHVGAGRGALFMGRAPGLRNDAVGGSDDALTPWRINMLTASRSTLAQVVFGLSERFSYGAAAPLFGPQHPEPFPLGIEEGRYLRLVGEEGDYGWENFTSIQMNPTWLADTGGTSRFMQVSTVSRMGVYADFAAALDLAVGAARRVYNEGWTQTNTASHITGLPCTARELQGDIIREVWRIMGEPNIALENGIPTSIDGIIAGGIQPVGYGDWMPATWNLQRDTWNLNQREAFWKTQEKGFMAPGINSRAVEFLLNDIAISLFGAANPDWEPGHTDCSRAVDFNRDGMAESTLTGWWNGQRTVWSWWWNGLPPTESLDPDLSDTDHRDDVPDWMQQAAWYRFDDSVGGSGIIRLNGNRWEELETTYGSGEAQFFKRINGIWLNPTPWTLTTATPGKSPGALPIRPFSHTGRLIIGHSDTFTIFLRSQLVDLRADTVLLEDNREIVFHVDPDRDGDCTDSYVSHEQPFAVNNIWLY